MPPFAPEEHAVEVSSELKSSMARLSKHAQNLIKAVEEMCKETTHIPLQGNY